MSVFDKIQDNMKKMFNSSDEVEPDKSSASKDSDKDPMQSWVEELTKWSQDMNKITTELANKALDAVFGGEFADSREPAKKEEAKKEETPEVNLSAMSSTSTAPADTAANSLSAMPDPTTSESPANTPASTAKVEEVAEVATLVV